MTHLYANTANSGVMVLKESVGLDDELYSLKCREWVVKNCFPCRYTLLSP